MINLFLFSPLEQFEFTLIFGKLVPNFEIFDLLLPLDKDFKKNSLNILLSENVHQQVVFDEISNYLSFIAPFLSDRLILSPAHYDYIHSLLVEQKIMNEFYTGSEGVRWYKNLDFFYIWSNPHELVTAYLLTFDNLLADKNLYVDITEAVDNRDNTFKELLLFDNNNKQAGLVVDENTFCIIAGYVLTDIYVTPTTPGGFNPSLTYLSNVFYNWISDSLLLNDLFKEEYYNYTIADYMNKKIGLTAIDMHNRDLTTYSFYWLNIYNSLFIVITLIVLIFIVFNRGYTNVPNVWQILNTLTFDFLLKSFISLANRNLLVFFPIFFCFFIFIYLLNLTALTPFSFCLTSNLWFSLSLSFSVWFGVTALAIIVRGENFFYGFVPKNIESRELAVFITIIEVISYVARALSLGVRIFANMLAGHSLVHILSDLTATCFVEFDNIGLKIFGIFPAIILSFILVIEFGICFLQGLVFVILTAIYLKEAFEGH